MFPITLDVKLVRIMLIGDGPAALRRLNQLDAAGAEHVIIYSSEPVPELFEAAGGRLLAGYPQVHDFANVQVVIMAGVEDAKAKEFATIARAYGALVNVEDRKPFCDFHFPSIVRRGDLLLTVSSGGTTPALAKIIAGELAEWFGPEWENFTLEIADLREQWKQEGRSMAEITRRTEEYVRTQGWLQRLRVSEPEEA